MKLIGVCWSVFLLTLIGGAYSQRNGKMLMSLYYETLCPDCIQFISDQMYKTWKTIGDSFDIEFVPYGNAETLPTAPPTFKCQHGKRECAGNKIHACALKYIPSESITPFIICTMKNKDPPSAGQKCADSLQLDFTPVKNCYINGEGDKLLYNFGEQTKKLDPPHTYVPWILFNGTFSEADNERAQNDLFHVICSYLYDKPSLCNSVSVW